MIDKGQWREFSQDTGVAPLLFTRCAMGFFITTECQDLSLTSHRQLLVYLKLCLLISMVELDHQRSAANTSVNKMGLDTFVLFNV